MLEDAMISLHLGAPTTGSDLLIKSLLTEAAAQNDTGLHIPPLKSYRDPLIGMAAELQGKSLTQRQKLSVYETIFSGGQPELVENIVLSSDYFLSFPPYIFHGAELYDRAGMKGQWVRRLFPENPCEFFITIRNPATFIPQLLLQYRRLNYEELIGHTDLRSISWYDVIARLDNLNENDPITVFLYEDAPLNWENMVRAIGGFSDSAQMLTRYDMALSVLSPEGKRWLTTQSFIEGQGGHKDLLEKALSSYLVGSSAAQEISLRSWTQDLVEEMTANYEDDVKRIKGLTGVVVVEP